ncbi:lipid-A-disaccharide synthase [bacterium]
MSKKIFISCGDVSGDMHASCLCKQLKNDSKDIEITGIGGENLNNTDINFLSNTIKAEGFGFNSLIKKYLFFKKLLKKRIIPFFHKNKPDLVILVDFYGFNIHIAKHAKQFGIPVIYYISPQVWASRKNRIKKLEKYVDQMLLFFPFEKQVYAASKLLTTFIGHPSLDILETDSKQKLKKDNRYYIGLLPGSRKQEITRLLPIMLDVFKNIGLDKITLYVFISSEKDKRKIKRILKNYPFSNVVRIANGKDYELRKLMDFCLVSSGTVTIETMIFETPMIVLYKLPLISYLIAKMIIKVNYIAMPNILADSEIIPEFVQNINIEKVRNSVNKWLLADTDFQKVKSDLLKVKNLLGSKGALKRASSIILKFLK